MRQEWRHVNEIAGLRARDEFAVRAPTHFAYARQNVCDGMLYAVMVNARPSALLDLEHARPQLRFDAGLRRNCGQALRAGRLQRALIEFRRANDADGRGTAHRLIVVVAHAHPAIEWTYGPRDPIAASPTDLAVCSAIRY